METNDVGVENGTPAIPNTTNLLPRGVPPPPVKMSKREQCALYIGVFIGVLLSECLVNPNHAEISTTLADPINIIISAVIAIVIVPNVYQGLGVDTDAPFLVQFGLFVQNGLFWDVIFNSVGKAVF